MKDCKKEWTTVISILDVRCEEKENQIIEAVSDIMGISVEDIMSRKRNAEINYTRQIAMYFLRNYTRLKLSSIGKKFNRHHSTVMHSIDKITGLIGFYDDVTRLVDKIEYHVINVIGCELIKRKDTNYEFIK